MGLPLILLYLIIPTLLAQDCSTPPMPGTWPWLVGINHLGQHACGGSLINHDWVLSVASCFVSRNTNEWTVNLGRIGQNTTNLPEVTRSVQEIIVHHLYDDYMHENDVALIKLSNPVDFNSTISPVCLAAPGSVFSTDTMCLSLGLGNIPMNGSFPAPPMFQELEVPIVGNKQCTCQYGGSTSGYISPLKICVESARGMCMGDSGGPLMCQQNSMWVQAGIASFKLSCNKAYPDIYTHVSEFQAWITQHINPSTVGFVTVDSPGINSDEFYTCYDYLSIFGAANIWLPTRVLFLAPVLILFEFLYGAF